IKGQRKRSSEVGHSNYAWKCIPRLHLIFEVLHIALKLIDARSERKNVVAFRVVYVFEHFREPRKFGP
ncbi:MAG: hypothetical protein WAV38_26750, partial [Xanthobacteraceae bacterium]